MERRLEWFARVARTVRYLRWTQIYHQVWYRVNRRPRIASAAAPPRRADCRPPQTYLQVSGPVFSDQWTFSFLNRDVSFPPGKVDWRAAGVEKLWRYNLHYFDCLQSASLSNSHKATLIDSWIASNPPGAEDAWEPYPISLRVVNWIKHFQTLAPGQVSESWSDSLGHQVRWLERRLEYHLLANHLFKNAVALVFAGVWFGGDRGDRWLRLGWRLFRRELAEQFLEDGGHFERSPMYHAIGAIDCVDVLNAIGTLPRIAFDGVDQTEEATGRALSFLRDMILPDGELAIFNDAAHDMVPPVQDILDYAARVLPRAAAHWEERSQSHLIERAATGVFGFREGSQGLLIDCGPVGPDYQPGHTHCDTLSYEWVLDGRRVVVDTGTFDYEPGARRDNSRATRTHNTVELDGQEQSEIWGVFRVARRARPLNAKARWRHGVFEFEGAHDGYCRLAGAPVVHRRLTWRTPGSLEVVERITGQGHHVARSSIHFHPELTIVIEGDYAVVSSAAGDTLAVVSFQGDPRVEIESAEYYPTFGVAQRNHRLVLSCQGRLPIMFGYHIRRATREP